MRAQCNTAHLTVGRHLQWTAAMMPELEQSGELVKVLKREKELAIARDEYRWGIACLHGSAPAGRKGTDKPGKGTESDERHTSRDGKENGAGAGGGFVSVVSKGGGLGFSTLANRAPGAIRRDPFAAYEWLRRSARRGDPKGMAALATLLVNGDAGVVDETEAARWYEAAAAGGCRSALMALGSLRLKQADRGHDGAQNRLASAVRSFRRAAELGASDAWVWLAQAQEKLERLNAHNTHNTHNANGHRQHRGGEAPAVGAVGSGAEGDTGAEGGAGAAKSSGGGRGGRQARRAMYMRAAEAGSAQGAFWTAHSLARGRLPPSADCVMNDEILSLVRVAASRGHAGAQFVLGCAVLLGLVHGSALQSPEEHAAARNPTALVRNPTALVAASTASSSAVGRSCRCRLCNRMVAACGAAGARSGARCDRRGPPQRHWLSAGADGGGRGDGDGGRHSGWCYIGCGDD